MDDEIEEGTAAPDVCGGCGRTLSDAARGGPAIGLIEDGTLLCRSCATEAGRQLDPPPLEAA